MDRGFNTRRRSAERHGSAAALAADLRRFLAREPIAARPASFTYQLRLFARRNRGLVAATCAAVVALVAGAIVSVRFAWLESQRAAEAEAARVRAVKERAVTDEVATLLQRLVESADPAQSDADLPMRVLLDRFARELEVGLTQDPQVRARLRAVLAEAYRNLGRHDDAERLARGALEDLAPLEVDTRASRATLHDVLGAAALARQDVATGERELNAAIALRRELGPAFEGAVTGSLDKLGMVRHQQGRSDEAKELLRDAVARGRARVADDPIALARSLNNLGTVSLETGDLDAAEALWNEAGELFAEHGPGYSERAAILANQGFVAQRRGRLADAEALYTRSLELREARVGAQSAEAASTVQKIASFKLARSDFAGAERDLDRVIEIRRARLGAISPLLAQALADLANVLMQAGRPEDAAKRAEEAVSILQKSLPADHRDLGGPLLLLGLAQVRLGAAEEAEEPLRRAVAIRTAALGAGHWQTANARSVLGECLLDLGEPEDAEALLTESVAILEKALGPTHAQTTAAAARLSRLREVQAAPAGDGEAGASGAGKEGASGDGEKGASGNGNPDRSP
jgi:tetratricopeptide (TPR) repeat protein